MTDLSAFYNDLLGRIGRLESHLFNGGKGIVYKVSILENQAENLSESARLINELENRVIVIEERCQRQGDNAKFRQMVSFISAFPFGWKGITISWVLATALISSVVEITDIGKIIANFLGAK